MKAYPFSLMKKVILAICIIIGIFYHGNSKTVETMNEEIDLSIEITVQGAVKAEGVYKIVNGTMEELLTDVELDEQADIACISYERLLYHGDLVYIPYNGEKISLNNATQEELMSISGIGEKKSQAIIDGRPYTSIEQIMDISGIGEKSYLKWRENLCL